MKNSAETSSGSSSSGFSLFSIDEHRLSVGLLVLFLLSITGYGIWLAIAGFLPEKAVVETHVSRKAIAEEHYKNQDWNKAVEVYGDILRDDPENGYAARGIAIAWEDQLEVKWKEYETVNSRTGSVSASEKILNEESRLFKVTTNSWNRLLDNARYQREAYIRLAVLHCSRSTVLRSNDQLEEAVRILEEMFQKELATSLGISKHGDLKPLQDHAEFARLEREENRILYQNPGSGHIRRRMDELPH